MSGKLWKTMENEWKTMENYGKLKSLWRKKTGTHSKKLDRDAPKMASDVNGNFMRRKKTDHLQFWGATLVRVTERSSSVLPRNAAWPLVNEAGIPATP